MTAPTTCSTHVLDAALGRPAAGIVVRLTTGAGTDVARAVTDADGRIRFDVDLGSDGDGDGDGTRAYALIFATGTWFAAQGRDCFHPEVTVPFTATAGEHHHVALLLSPFAYTTYRGS